MKQLGLIILISLMSNSLFSQQQDTTKWNFGVTVKLGASSAYPLQDDYRRNYPGVYPYVISTLSGLTEPGFVSDREQSIFSFAIGTSIQYNFSQKSAIEMGLLFNTKGFSYPKFIRSFSQSNDPYWKGKITNDAYYIDVPVSYQHSFLIGSKPKIRISAGVTGCIFLFGDQTNEFFLDMNDKAVVIHRGNYQPIAMMLNGSLEYVFPFFNNHIAIGPTFQIAPFSLTRKENTISSPHRYGGQTYKVSEHYEFKPYFIGAGITYYLR